MERLEHISKSLSKIQHKKFELYVISRIIHSLDDPTIKYVFQQYATRKEGEKYALIDLYLPQFQIAIEVDEPYHLGQLFEDDLRKNDIEVLDIEVDRIDCSKGIVCVNKQIDDEVNKIRQRKSQEISNGSFREWDGKTGYEHYCEQGYFSIDDETVLTSPTEICNCFGLANAHQSGGRNFDGYCIWYPKENEGENSWYNKLEENEDNVIITEYHTDEERRDAHLKKILKGVKKRIVFYYKKNMLNERLYRFKGVFELNVEETKEVKKCIWQRVSKKCYMPKSIEKDWLDGIIEEFMKQVATKTDCKKVNEYKNKLCSEWKILDDKESKLKQELERFENNGGYSQYLKKFNEDIKACTNQDEKREMKDSKICPSNLVKIKFKRIDLLTSICSDLKIIANKNNLVDLIPSDYYITVE